MLRAPVPVMAPTLVLRTGGFAAPARSMASSCKAAGQRGEMSAWWRGVSDTVHCCTTLRSIS